MSQESRSRSRKKTHDTAVEVDVKLKIRFSSMLAVKTFCHHFSSLKCVSSVTLFAKVHNGFNRMYEN